jgi:hypothetical protein
MSSFRRICVLALLAVWLVATQHCGLVAAELWDAFGPTETAVCLDHEDGCDSGLAHDGCTPAEKGLVASWHAVKVSAPHSHECVCVLVVTLEALMAAEESAVVVEAVEQPKAWLPLWHFERRAVQPARAPSSILA